MKIEEENMLFPKINSNKLKGITGQAYFQYFVNECLKCIYYPVSQEGDFGIDGYIGLVINQNATGKLLGIQIKHGNSYFKKQTSQSYQYFGDMKQLNYYSNSQVPIFIIIMNDDFTKMNWVQFDITEVTLVNSTKWSLAIPKENEIRTNFKEAILDSVYPIIDYRKQLQATWSRNSTSRDMSYETRGRLRELNYKKMGQIIHQRRKKLGYTQEKLAEKVEISPCYIGEIERGTSKCSLTVIVNIAVALKINLDNLVRGEETELDGYAEILQGLETPNKSIFIKLCKQIANSLK